MICCSSAIEWPPSLCNIFQLKAAIFWGSFSLPYLITVLPVPFVNQMNIIPHGHQGFSQYSELGRVNLWWDRSVPVPSNKIVITICLWPWFSKPIWQNCKFVGNNVLLQKQGIKLPLILSKRPWQPCLSGHWPLVSVHAMGAENEPLRESTK